MYGIILYILFSFIRFIMIWKEITINCKLDSIYNTHCGCQSGRLATYVHTHTHTHTKSTIQNICSNRQHIMHGNKAWKPDNNSQ